jgi:F0F1-type ATP synthase membrane subunit b/b'|tara:strand:+ start:450 stop:824 length:375 start_codon:yes stop_codon:yes gene_type:complete
MSWKDILKASCGSHREKVDTEKDEKQQFEKLVGNQKRIDVNNDGKITAEDFAQLREKTKKAEKSIEQIKKEIFQEVVKEGGALGMKNLKSIASQDLLDKAISQLMQEQKLFEHKHGDFYTHSPK